MKIIQLTAENIKKLKVVEIRPTDSTVIISGKNEQGKSSVLDSIWYALGGAEALKDTHKPIREGESSAKVILDLGEIIVTRKWTADDKSYLTVENKDGATFKSPQAILDKLVGNLSFDPLAFSHRNEREQKEILLSLVNIDLDLNKWEADRKAKYDDRTVLNRRIKEIEGQIAGMPAVLEGTPDEEVDLASIMGEIRKAQRVKERNEEKKQEFLSLRKTYSEYLERKKEIEDEMKDIQEQIEVLQNRFQLLNERADLQSLIISDTANQVDAMQCEVNALLDPDMSIFETKINEMEKTNQAVRAKKEWIEIKNMRYARIVEKEKLTSEIEDMDMRKIEAIKAAKFPIEYLAFDDNGVTYKGIPFSQCSTAERLRVSLAMAMAMNPKLRVLRIMDGSLLDSENMKVIQEMVSANDYQCWIERVQEEPGVGVHIYDGEVKA